MENENQIPTTPDFSDVPALGDTQGLENFLNNQALAAQGLPVQQPAAQPAAQPTTTTTPAPAVDPNAQPAPATNPAAPATGLTQSPAQPAGDSVTLTRDQYNALLAGRNPVQPQANPAPKTNAGYTQQEQAFIVQALAKGYSLDQINNFLTTRKAQSGVNPAFENRIAAVEEYLRTQEYKTAETAFINKLTDFGNKWGLSEQDLVTFGQEALKQGINIAAGNVNLETVFRAVYPQQYAIRSQRMNPTNSSQIYGGTSVPEGNRASAAKLEDAYVENFLKGAMPNQYGMLNKK